jgi:hypothetical protein
MMPAMLFVLLLYTVYTALAASSVSSSGTIEWINATSDVLSTLYTTYDHCVITASLRSHSSVFGKHANETLPSPCTLSDNEVEKQCSTFANFQNTAFNVHIPESMTHVVPHLMTSYPHLRHISHLLLHLNQSNRALVLIGDSITRNSIEALLCILQMENYPSPVTITPPLDKILYNTIHYTISLPFATIHLLYNSIWHSFQPGKGGTTTTFYGELQRFIFNKQYPDMGALVVFNIGMHERGQNMMTKNLIEMFTFARETLIPTPNRNVSFLYREASVQHYPDSPAGLFNRNKAKQWHTGEVPSPICAAWRQPNDLTAAGQNWRHRAEQSAIEQSQWEGARRIIIIPFRDLSAHFWDLHAASPFFKGSFLHLLRSGQRRRRKHSATDEDCTHFNPKAASLLYRLLWHQILVH